MKKTTYIVLEGVDGSGKNKLAERLTAALRTRGFSVLLTNEPGTSTEATKTLRGIMLDARYEDEMTKEAREMIAQASRSIHLNRVIYPALGEVDFIIQDRGILSAYAYGVACGNSLEFMKSLAVAALGDEGKKQGLNVYNLYDHIIVCQGAAEIIRPKVSEFEAGDVIENQGPTLIEKVNKNFTDFAQHFQKVTFLPLESKSPETLVEELLQLLDVV